MILTVVAWVLNGALLLEMIRYKLARWLFIYQRLLCVKFVLSVNYLSKWEERGHNVNFIVTCTTKKMLKFFVSVYYSICCRVFLPL